jgi:hypothetical protein
MYVSSGVARYLLAPSWSNHCPPATLIINLKNNNFIFEFPFIRLNNLKFGEFRKSCLFLIYDIHLAAHTTNPSPRYYPAREVSDSTYRMRFKGLSPVA